MDTLLQDLRFALRSLRHRPGFTAVATLTLALGIGATTAIWSVVYGVLLRPLPYPEAERIVALWQTSRENAGEDLGGTVSPVAYSDWREQARSFEAVALYSPASAVVTGLGEAEVVPAAIVTPDFFRVFGAAPIRGRELTAAEDLPNGPRVIVVSHGFWQERLGGRPDVLGATLDLSGRPWEIVGVAPPRFDFPNHARLWFPVQNDAERCGRGCVYLNGVARLAPGVPVAAARDEMRTLALRLEQSHPETNTDATIALSTLGERLVGPVRDALVVLFLAVALVLLIACANVANLLLARGSTRGDEIAVRAALGAGRGRITRQLLTETLLLAALGGIGGVALAYGGVAALHRLAPDLPRLEEVSLDGPALLFALALAAATAFLFGLAPALTLARSPLATVLRQGGRAEAGDPARTWGRSALLAAEVGLSVMLLLGAGLLVRSFAAVQAVEPGYRTAGLAHFALSLPSVRYPVGEPVLRAMDAIETELEAQPGVSAVARVLGLPLGSGENMTSFTRPDRPAPPPGREPGALYFVASHDYFDVLDLAVVEGRPFERTDRHGAVPVAIVNRAAADRFWPGESPIGRAVTDLITIGGLPEEGPRTIVGVVADARTRSLTQEPRPELYVPFDQVAPSRATFVVRTAGGTAQALAAARLIVRDHDPLLPMIAPGTLSELVDAQLARPRFYLTLLSLFAVLALMLAAVGIYGVVAYGVARRTREIGVRMALGATPGRVLRLVVRQGMVPALLGMTLGLAGALVAGRLMTKLLYQVRPHDPLAMAAAAVVLLAVVLVACLLPARRATRVPPASALRSD